MCKIQMILFKAWKIVTILTMFKWFFEKFMIIWQFMFAYDKRHQLLWQSKDKFKHQDHIRKKYVSNI